MTPASLLLYKTLMNNLIEDEPNIPLKSIAPQNKGNDRGRGAVKTGASKEIDEYISKHMDDRARDIGIRFGITATAVRARKNRIRAGKRGEG